MDNKHLKYLNSIFVFSLLIAMFFIVGCNDDDDDDNNDDTIDSTDVIMPLAAGNYWQFEEKHYYDETIVVEVDTELIEIEKDTLIEGNFAWKWLQEGMDYFFNNLDDGLYWYAYRDSSGVLHYYEPSVLMYKYPAEIGDEWSGVELFTKDTLISTPAGDFICYGYLSSGNPMSRKYFFSPGIGYIGTTTYYFTELNKDKKLIDYHIASQ